MQITYHINDSAFTKKEFIDILLRSGLSERRPINNPEVMDKMVGNASLIVLAKDNEKIVGVARALTDYAYVCYLSCLAIDKAYQGKGIGKELISKVKEAIGQASSLVLLSAPGVEEYYLDLGFNRIDNGFIMPRKNS
ncbi:MAG: family acetyltransferase [Gammaproteobacteria bacterium]|jgi:N-acetylglutamate synthase-like GNAT family acetyltransferase|nr:family acetyltransferase [Gammaproteobacteria bacterium]